MSNYNYFSSLVEQSIKRSAEATLSILGITNPELREHLNNEFISNCGDEGSFLASPVFEQMFGWASSSDSMIDLSEKHSLISKVLVDALDKKNNGKYRFKSSLTPYTHQLTSWKALLEDKKSIVVTSGTGSGKTECFMIPILEDLYQEYQANSKSSLEGVRALFLYPLNALINSQKERLHAWTKHFYDGIRFCLYNGNTKEFHSNVIEDQRLKPNEVLSRELMREKPAPILVTNGTMLEYMMVRQVDSPILKKSRDNKTLRWIVLDEAHTYVGSQAAELAMQLRRVMHAFGVKASDIRFIATSATIGGGEETTQKLQKFLSDLSGVPVEQVLVVTGSRTIPQLSLSQDNNLTVDEIASIPSPDLDKPEISLKRYEALSNSFIARSLREIIVGSPKPLTLNDIVKKLYLLTQKKLSEQEVLKCLDVSTYTKPSEEEPAFLRLRAHIFQRNTHGLWSCFNNKCTAKKETELSSLWPYGRVFTKQRTYCICGSPVFELAFCKDCKEPHLLASEENEGNRLVHWEPIVEDEFSLLTELSEEDDLSDSDSNRPYANGRSVVLSSHSDQESYISIKLDVKNASFNITDADHVSLGLNPDPEKVCSNINCQNTGGRTGEPFRRAILGVPFYISNVVPTVLEYCPDFKSDEEKKSAYGANSLPGRGRRLITFTDSRQGTARLTIRMQQVAERNRLRGLVVEVLRKKSTKSNDELNPDVKSEDLLIEAQSARDSAEKFIKMGLSDRAQNKIKEAKELELIANSIGSEPVKSEYKEIPWLEVVKELKDKTDIKENILRINKKFKPLIFDDGDGVHKIAEMLLFREFMRRPKLQNSLETQGLVQLSYSGLDDINNTPMFWDEHNLSIQDWKDFLKVALDFYVRENTYIAVDEGWGEWIGTRFSEKRLINPNFNYEDENRVRKWPLIRGKSFNNRLVKLLFLGANLSPKKTEDVDVVNEWLLAAWSVLCEKNILSSDGNKHYLSREAFTFSLLDKAYVCPITNKILDVAFKGFTPYLPTRINFDSLSIEQIKKWQTKRVELPDLHAYDTSQYDYDGMLQSIRSLSSKDEKIKNLRAENLWTDINDRAIEGGFFYTIAEHSAQQSSEQLDRYENDFKAGKLNVLNCSTTMEMGVDIAGVSAVVMNNVPPHPANYLQRAGRAGRGSESRAIAYTICRNNPHDLQVFDNPYWPFETVIPAPSVTLNSERLIRRHVNSFLLSYFLCEVLDATSEDRTRLTTKWFFASEEEISICDQFLQWLKQQSLCIDSDLEQLVENTKLSYESPYSLRNNACNMLSKMQSLWLQDYEYLLKEELSAKKNSTYFARIQIEKSRHCNEYLLRELAARTFLPGYGFPTDVVAFDNFTNEDYKISRRNVEKGYKKDRDDNISRYKGLASRNLSIAIREYAPGADIALDGRIFRSAGISMHWKNLSVDSIEAQKIDVAWRCGCCGQLGYVSGTEKLSGIKCSSCESSVNERDIRRVIRPSGFVTDSYSKPTNNIETQRFIPVEVPWVFSSDPLIDLPNPDLGKISYSADGEIIHFSSGEFGKGYALCLTCGRAESMLANGNYPKGLSPDSTHYSPRITKEDRDTDGVRSVCLGSSKTKKDMHIGARSVTDVFELILRSPKKNEFLLDGNDNNKAIAITLAIALRNSLSKILGISANELGYSYRPIRLEGDQAVIAIQVYDQIAGGAGFSTSAPLYINRLLAEIVNQLQCEHCDLACSECLLDSDTRHDYNRINRKLALDWIDKDLMLSINHTD